MASGNLFLVTCRYRAFVVGQPLLLSIRRGVQFIISIQNPRNPLVEAFLRLLYAGARHLRELLHQIALSTLLHINVIHVKAPVACDHHDLRRTAAHGYDTAQWASTCTYTATASSRSCGFWYLHIREIPLRVKDLGYRLGEVRSNNTSDTASHNLRRPPEHAAKGSTLSPMRRGVPFVSPSSSAGILKSFTVRRASITARRVTTTVEAA